MILSALSLVAVLRSQTDLPEVVVDVLHRGKFVIRVEKYQAPKLSLHFLGLVDKGFYDGILWHRKVDGFVIQTGDPASKKVDQAWALAHPGERGGTKDLGEGGSGASVPFEINDLVHDKYTVGMALESPMDDSGDSQFFINIGVNHRLNGMYEVFGEVTEGKSVVDSVKRADKILSIRRKRS